VFACDYRRQPEQEGDAGENVEDDDEDECELIDRLVAVRIRELRIWGKMSVQI
jgi:hypothetical protein